MVTLRVGSFVTAQEAIDARADEMTRLGIAT